MKGMFSLVIGALALMMQSGVINAQAPTCDAYLYASEFYGKLRENPHGACSGQGNCTLGVCTCEAGFTGLSDLINTEGLDCHISTLAIKIMWGINLALAFGYFVMGLPRVWLRWQTYKAAKEAKIARGLKYSMWNNRGMMACAIFFGLGYPSILLMGLLKVVSNEERVGVTFGATFLFASARTGFYGAVWLFQPALLQTVLKGKQSTAHLVKLADRASAVVCLFAAILGWTPFFTYFLADNDPTGSVAMSVYYTVMGGTMITTILFGLQALVIMILVVKVLDKSFSLTKSAKTVQLKQALVAVQREAIVQAAIQSIIYGLFTFYPYLYNKHDYFLPVGWLAYIVIGKKLAYTTIRDGNASTQGASTNGSKSESNSQTKAASSFLASRNPATTIVENSPTQSRFAEVVASYHEPVSIGLDDDEEYV